MWSGRCSTEKLRGAAFAVTISDYNLRLLAGWYGRLADRVEVIHCGVDAAVFRPRSEDRACRQRTRARARPFEVLSIATLQPQKGHAVLVAAARPAGRAWASPVRVRMVGEGEERPALEAAIAAAGLTDQVQLLGRQPRDRVAALLGEADVVVQPSIVLPSGKTEGIPVALMEALASGVPVVATSVSGVPELVEDGVTGRLVPPGDAEALADALVDIQRDPARGSLACRCRPGAGPRLVRPADEHPPPRRAVHRRSRAAAGRQVEPLSPETVGQLEAPSP